MRQPDEYDERERDHEGRPLQKQGLPDPPDLPDLSSVRPEDVTHLVQQLHVQQVQLEMQNEELRKFQELLAESCDHYAQLYDFSPAGYVTLTPEGTIAEANLRFCAMVGVHRKQVLVRPFSDFVAPQDWDVWTRHRGDVLDARTIQMCKLRLLPKIGLPLTMHIESMANTDHPNRTTSIQTAMLDITLRERAEEAVKESQRKVQHAAAKLLTAQDEERGRIARDLHDDHCQRLAALIMEVSHMPKRHPGPWSNPVQQLQPIKISLAKLLADLRTLSHDLHPGRASVDLEHALRAYAAEFMDKANIETTFHASGPGYLPAVVSTTLYRIAQEGLANIRKHAKARRIRLTLHRLPDAVELLIKDDGRGFEPESVRGTHHLGLTSVRERAEQLNGTLTVTSRPGWGTTLVVRIPLEAGFGGAGLSPVHMP